MHSVTDVRQARAEIFVSIRNYLLKIILHNVGVRTILNLSNLQLLQPDY